MAGRLQVIEASGSHYDIGFQIGRQTREQTCALAGALRRTRADDPTTCARHAEYMTHVEQFPFIMDELRGMADGAGLPPASRLGYFQHPPEGDFRALRARRGP